MSYNQRVACLLLNLNAYCFMRVSLFIILLLLAGCSGTESYLINENQLTVNIDNTGEVVKLVVHSPGIIQVISSPGEEFSMKESLVALVQPTDTPFSVDETDTSVVITTIALSAHIKKHDGQVSFYNPAGERIVAESGRSFSKLASGDTVAYSILQKFNTPPDEALYGLGQHQAHEINYKGKNEELFQYNTKVSVPFIVSTKNYGILWDNYSFTRYGDPRPYANLNVLNLSTPEGEGGGLLATYRNKQTGGAFTSRKEARIDYENLETIEEFPDVVDFTNAIVTWEGFMEVPEPGTYHFLCYYAGYTRLWINGELQFDRWRTAWNPSVAKFDMDFETEKKYHVKLEWIPDGGVSYIGLKVLTPTDIIDSNGITFSSEEGRNVNYYFLLDESMDGVVSQYRRLTGKAQVMPKWSMGFWQSRERYKTQQELLDVLSEFRRRKIPIDNIVQDWSYWPVNKWGSHEFDSTRFQDVQDMVNQVHDQNTRIMISVWPKFYIGTEHYNEFNSNGWMYTQAVEDSIRDWIWPGYIGSFYDAYSSEARELFWEQIREHLYTKGFDAWWLDATEPDILSNASIDYRKKLMNPTAMGPSSEYFNAYALMNAKGIYEGQRQENPNDRVFILTRSGFSGIQRYGAVTWSGDIGTRWEDMRAQISAGINFALSGLPYWTMDIGGFCVEKRYERAEEGSEDLEEWRELNTRWYQFGAFVPLFRSHGQFPFREIWKIAPEGNPAFASMLKYNKLRYRLMPYIYSLAGWTYLRDYTIMRGLAMDFPADRDVLDIGDQYMFGPDLMICPVTHYKARSRMVYLPESANWYNGITGEYYKGGQYIETDAPYESMPVFIRSGSILPVGPDIEYVNQKKEDPITVVVYEGADGAFDLYEDDGSTYAYEGGEYSLISFKWDDSSKSLSISDRQGTFDGLVEERKFNIVLASQKNPVPLNAIPYNGKEVLYSGSAITQSFR